MLPGLLQDFMDGYIKFWGSLPLLVELQVPNSGDFKAAGSMCNEFSISHFEICVQNQREHKILSSLQDCNTSGPSSITVRVECLLLFNSGIVNFVWKTNEGETENVIMLIFVWGAL